MTIEGRTWHVTEKALDEHELRKTVLEDHPINARPARRPRKATHNCPTERRFVGYERDWKWDFGKRTQITRQVRGRDYFGIDRQRNRKDVVGLGHGYRFLLVELLIPLTPHRVFYE